MASTDHIYKQIKKAIKSCLRPTFFIIGFALLVCINAYSQSSYFATDSLISVGVRLEDGGDVNNCQSCRIIVDKKVITYTPDEVREYSFKNGPVYVSKEVRHGDTTRRVFLERLTNGNNTLYFYREKNYKMFIIESPDGKLHKVPKRGEDTSSIGYHEILSDMLFSCENTREVVNLTRYTKNSMTRIIKYYNSCRQRPFPHYKYGITGGYMSVKLEAPTDIDNPFLRSMTLGQAPGFMVGLFLDSPIQVSDFSFRIEALFTNYQFSYSESLEDMDLDFTGNVSGISLPIMLKYLVPFYTIRPYVNAGAVPTYNFQVDNTFYRAKIGEEVIEVAEMIKTPYISEFELGAVIGAGLEFNLNYRRAIHLELRYIQNFYISSPETLNSSFIQISTGVNL